jgi:putative acetyltransferase
VSIDIRDEQPADAAAIRKVNNLAFGQELEGNIVAALRTNGAALLSLVATDNGRIVGHIMYSRVMIGGELVGAGLGPMAVLPDYQRQGIGSRLVTVGNERLILDGWPFIVVVGHPEYYPRFGFRPASAQRIQCEWEVPDEVFMLLISDEARMQGVAGLAKYPHEFNAAGEE